MRKIVFIEQQTVLTDFIQQDILPFSNEDTLKETKRDEFYSCVSKNASSQFCPQVFISWNWACQEIQFSAVQKRGKGQGTLEQ